MPSEVVLALLAVGIAVIPWAMSIHSNNHDTEISRLAATRAK